MKKTLQHISALAVAAVLLFASCRRSDEAKVIPRDTLAEIYAEMLVTDQWISSTPGVRMIADTSLVYEPILEKYGYSTRDYRKSIDKYMDDPERFARILRTTGEILDGRIKDLRVELGKVKAEEARLKVLEEMLAKVKSDFRAEEFFPYMFDEPYVHYYDSVAVKADSVLYVYRMRAVETADTLYDGLRMVIVAERDSLFRVDSLARADSIAVADSMARIDSIARADSIAKSAKSAKAGKTGNTGKARKTTKSVKVEKEWKRKE